MNDEFRTIQEMSNRAQLDFIASGWEAWTPTLTWGGVTPDGITTKARYKIIGKTVFFNINVVATDGNGSSANSFKSTLPVAPKNQSFYTPVSCMHTIGVTSTARYAVINDDGVNNNIAVFNSAFTDASALSMSITGFYEIA